MARSTTGLFRTRGEHGHAPVTYIELFFDLVFVFAITQLSHGLLEHLGWTGALQTLILLFAVWWVWIYTTWVANWLDPERANVRLMLILLMLAGLVLSSAIPYAFGVRGWMFAAAYCTIQIGRSLYMVWASWGVHPARARSFLRIVFWLCLSLPLWVAGCFVDAQMRMLLWAAALLIDYAGPLAFFRTPGLGRSTGADWEIAGGHMAERCALFVIISLGEGVLVTGATFATLPQDGLRWLAFATCFLGSAALWWLYFDTGARRGSQVIEASDQAGLLARNAYTYWHIPIIAGLVVSAVADEMLLAHPQGHIAPAMLAVSVGGPLLFLIGNMAFKKATTDRPLPPFSHMLGSVGLLGVGAWAWLGHWQPLTLGLALFAVLVFTAVWEWGSFHGGWRRWTPGLGRLFGVDPAAGSDT
ncbi:low temperature requirement protein A [Sphingopyxis panaciterrulae]|uniref:Low temperature requirement protein LtrA n=1 Tax=Sphingopyxis panaciterrulae TaxID=462372 RepID=A0A7W9ERC9_9SPHN|nr:low temperature requirement protein A [Sphingopyxis panaciterrulae]MBB5707563.1 low temperature requirement protein LtrA [Sphingopyxis panaciterrulae]